MRRYNKAFTLVELLLAMFIFALIAVMLIPNVTNNAERNLFATQVKKVQNDVQQAMLWIISENQGSMKTACPSGTNYKCIRDLIAGTTSASKKLESYCKFGYTNDEKIDNGRKEASNPAKQADFYIKRNPQFLNGDSAISGFTLNAHNENAYYAVYLKNGAYVSSVFDNSCNNSAGDFIDSAGADLKVCGYVEIDVNAGKAPNVIGKDIHYFWIMERDGLVPFGEMDALTCGSPNADTGKYDNDSAKPEDSSQNTPQTQFGCTARIMNMNSIDYY